MTADGKLVEDFLLEEADGVLHVLNAPSPGATASLPIGRMLAEKATAAFGL
jgi:(S)-2-hydroxyglutarate dehydrogenase